MLNNVEAIWTVLGFYQLNTTYLIISQWQFSSLNMFYNIMSPLSVGLEPNK